MATWLKRLIAIVLAVGVLAGLGEVALRLIIPGTIEGVARGQLGLSADHPVEASLGGSALLHALTGRVGDVDVTIEDLPVDDGIAVDARVHADSAPFNPLNGEIRGGSASLTLGPDQLDPVVQLVTSGIAESGEVRDGRLVVGRTVSVLGFDAPLSVALGLEVSDGDVVVTPGELSVVGQDIDAEQLAQAAGPALGGLLEPRTVCVADQLPRGVTLTGIELSSTGSAIVSADLSPGIVSDSDERSPGTCE